MSVVLSDKINKKIPTFVIFHCQVLPIYLEMGREETIYRYEYLIGTRMAMIFQKQDLGIISPGLIIILDGVLISTHNHIHCDSDIGDGDGTVSRRVGIGLDEC